MVVPTESARGTVAAQALRRRRSTGCSTSTCCWPCASAGQGAVGSTCTRARGGVSGAAIGVPEGITVILQHTQHLASLSDKLVMFVTGIVLFSIPLQIGFAALNLVRRRLSA